jgi:hypothetical protein
MKRKFLVYSGNMKPHVNDRGVHVLAGSDPLHHANMQKFDACRVDHEMIWTVDCQPFVDNAEAHNLRAGDSLEMKVVGKGTIGFGEVMLTPERDVFVYPDGHETEAFCIKVRLTKKLAVPRPGPGRRRKGHALHPVR